MKGAIFGRHKKRQQVRKVETRKNELMPEPYQKKKQTHTRKKKKKKKKKNNNNNNNNKKTTIRTARPEAKKDI